ncbi:hypothetical protein Peur_054816 [Populus x canadensis]
MAAQTSSFFQNDLNAMTFLSGSRSSQAISLVNQVFNPQHGKRIAVILNDFGEEIRVRREMINEREGGALVEEWFELANGCVCCAVKHSLVQALEQLVQMKGRRDHILLETTGLANPAPLAPVLWLDDLLEPAVKLDSIITKKPGKNEGKKYVRRENQVCFLPFSRILIQHKVLLSLHRRPAYYAFCSWIALDWKAVVKLQG